MTTRILLTGATGYVGGALLPILLSQLPPTCSITCFVRTEEQASLLKSNYMGIATVVGTLESRDVLIAEAAKTDIVLHAANVDHEEGTLALLDGLREHRRNSQKELLYFLVSGSGSIGESDFKAGETVLRKYSDVDDAEEIWNLPLDRSHVAVERRLIQGAKEANIKSITVAPGWIFHTGIGVGKKESYPNEHPRAIIKRGRAFVINSGSNEICWISIEDLAGAITFLLRNYLDEVAGTRISGQGYGQEGYYFVQTGELSFYEQADVIAQELHKIGAIQSKDVDHLNEKQALSLHPYGLYLWGSSMRSRAQKLKDLGWRPKDPDCRELLRRLARVEWESFQRQQKAKTAF